MAKRDYIRFLLNDAEVKLTSVGPNDTLLDFLRIERRLVGSKEGCAEGDCGACTVLVGKIGKNGLNYQSVNACIRLLASLDGCHVVTIEHLSPPEGPLHPIQRAMVDLHGSQCGFCTPGIVMSLYALWMTNPAPTRHEIETNLQGNLCRCTGYAPIIRAALQMGEYGSAANDALIAEIAKNTERLLAMADNQSIEIKSDDGVVMVPATVDDLATAYVNAPKATIVAGATDVGLWVTKFLRPISPVIHVSHLMQDISVSSDQITLGAGVTYSAAQEVMLTEFPHLSDYWNRIAGQQVRNMGTIGGNVANGSPIGDMPPVLIALDAVVVLRRGSERRKVKAEHYFIDYGKQDRAEGEFVESIEIPRAQSGQHHAAYKVSKRKHEDITSVALAIRLTVADGVISEARIAYGGMAGIPKRAASAEAALIGLPMSKSALTKAADAIAADFAPLTDMRATADYRMTVAQNLIHKFASLEVPA